MSKDVQPAGVRQVSFEVFRYPLVVDKAFQSNAFQTQYSTLQTLKDNKNTIFSSVITQNNFGFRSSNSDITSKLVHTSSDMYYFRVAVKRNTRHYKKDFSEEVIENYSNLLVAINSNPHVQKISIQTNTVAFNKTIIVACFIKETVEKFLRDYNISFSVEPTFDKQQFWNIVRQYPKQIKQVTFDLIFPNITNLSDDLQLDLRGLHGDTNTQKKRLELNADQDSYLTINEDSPLVNSIVNYSAKGGGEIAVKVEGIKRKLHTAQSFNDFNIEEQLLKSNDWDALDKAFRNILI